jgi:hypothetical protein
MILSHMLCRLYVQLAVSWLLCYSYNLLRAVPVSSHYAMSA